MRQVVSLFPVLLWLAACAEPDADHGVSDGEGDPRVIYGNDDRLDLYQVTVPAHLALADSVVMLTSANMVTPAPGGGWDVYTGSTYDLCPEERFYGQPDPGWCSGTLIGPDLVLTAGHCISQGDCAGTRVVAQFRMDDAATVRSHVDNGDVASCIGIVDRVYTGSVDYAIFQLDHALSHTVATVSPTAPAVGEQALMIGHPSGLPMKVAGGATIQSIENGFVTLNTDAYGGNSGSAVFRPDGTIGSILVRGNTDYIWDGQRQCYVSNTCSDTTGCPGFEEATLAYLALGGGSTCEDDDLEPNNSIATATPATEGGLADLQVCNDDWFAIALFAGESLTATASFQHSAGDIDIRLTNSNGTALTSSEGTTNTETVTWQVAADQTVYLRVFGYNGATNAYALDIAIDALPVCEDDGFEDNDTRPTAAPVALGAHPDLQVCEDDDDFFSISVPANRTLKATIAFEHDDGDLDLAILRGNGNTVASSTGSGDTETAQYKPSSTQTLYVRVYGYQGAGNAYDLDLSLPDTTPPTITVGPYSYNQQARRLDVRFTTNEPATGRVCDNRDVCANTPLGTSHQAIFTSTGRRFRVTATDPSGNTRTTGWFNY